MDPTVGEDMVSSEGNWSVFTLKVSQPTLSFLEYEDKIQLSVYLNPSSGIVNIDLFERN